MRDWRRTRIIFRFTCIGIDKKYRPLQGLNFNGKTEGAEAPLFLHVILWSWALKPRAISCGQMILSWRGGVNHNIVLKLAVTAPFHIDVIKLSTFLFC